ncbi:MAG: hypothetical protein LBD80_02430, partial [Tannerella sp.]|nr:hypothetical protein [Tannerella sp.]
MKTKREEKLEKALSLCRQALHRERQKNRDLQESRDKYKLKQKALNERLKESETIKKNGQRA